MLGEYILVISNKNECYRIKIIRDESDSIYIVLIEYKIWMKYI